MWIEVKASKINNYFGLIDKQLKNYERLLMNRFPWTNPKVEYIFFTYNIKKVFEECHNEESLIERLAQNTVSMLAMPLDIVGKIWEKSSRYNGSVYESFRYFKRSDANLFLSNLGEAFNKFDIKKEDYKIVKKKFSAGYSIEGAEIKQFDILKISHNGNYDRWLSDFRKNKESD